MGVISAFRYACRHCSSHDADRLPVVNSSIETLSGRYYTVGLGCICQIFTGGSEFRLAMTDRATIAGMEAAKLVPWNSLLNY